jgi:hypothetical protein
VIPVAALADQLPRYGDPSGSYRLSADIAGPVTLAFPCGFVAGALPVRPRRKTLRPRSRIYSQHFQGRRR